MNARTFTVKKPMRRIHENTADGSVDNSGSPRTSRKLSGMNLVLLTLSAFVLWGRRDLLGL